VRALASALAARVSPAGEGRWELRAPGLLAGLARHPAPEGVTAVEAVDVQAAEVAAVAAVAAEPRPFTASDPRFASFTALGARAPVCADPAAGTWVSTPNMFAHWHVFTLHVQPGARAGELLGTVNAHVWSGEADEAAPAACADHDLDVQVSMQGTGVRAPDGSFRFDAGAWRLDRGSCTGPGEGWAYLPDHFSGIAEGGALRTVNRDGSEFDNAPVGFERVSCE
jgi:hypothetical protein